MAPGTKPLSVCPSHPEAGLTGPPTEGTAMAGRTSLTFLGAARTVTGSKFLLDTG